MPLVVKLLLIDDDPSMRVVCDQANRTARVVKVPRAMLAQSADRPELSQVGLYLLVGDNVDEPDRPYVYVGESEGVFQRLLQHDKSFDKSWTWRLALVVLAQDGAINKAHVKYLEHTWYRALKAADAVELEQTTPAPATLNESELAAAEDFSATAKALVGVLGFRFFEPLVSRPIPLVSSGESQAPRFVFLTSKKTGNKAFGRPTSGGFLVEKGSQLDAEEKPSDAHYWKPVRDALRAQGVIGPVDGRLTFLTDWLTSSPSRAAAAVYGGSVNGLEYWRAEHDASPLRDWLAKHAMT